MYASVAILHSPALDWVDIMACMGGNTRQSSTSTTRIPPMIFFRWYVNKGSIDYGYRP
jgi:hypothetical protein